MSIDNNDFEQFLLSSSQRYEENKQGNDGQVKENSMQSNGVSNSEDMSSELEQKVNLSLENIKMK